MNENNKIYDLVIIGGGPAGLAAGIYAKRMAMETVLFEKISAGGQMVNAGDIENWPGTKKIAGHELSMNFYDHALSYGLQIESKEISKIEPGKDFHEVILDGGTCIKTYAVVIAAGGSPKKLGVLGENKYMGRGVSYCGYCDGFFFKGKEIAVVGGGDTALEESLYLSKLASCVYLIHRRDEFRGSKILRDKVMESEAITVILNTVLTNIEADDLSGAVNKVKLENVLTKVREELFVNGVFIFAGFAPDISLVPKGVEFSPDGYVVTDDRCETSIKGIFAAGDIRKKFARQIVTAAADGAVAALAASYYVDEKKKKTAN